MVHRRTGSMIIEQPICFATIVMNAPQRCTLLFRLAARLKGNGTFVRSAFRRTCPKPHIRQRSASIFLDRLVVHGVSPPPNQSWQPPPGARQTALHAPLNRGWTHP